MIERNTTPDKLKKKHVFTQIFEGGVGNPCGSFGDSNDGMMSKSSDTLSRWYELFRLLLLNFAAKENKEDDSGIKDEGSNEEEEEEAEEEGEGDVGVEEIAIADSELDEDEDASVGEFDPTPPLCRSSTLDITFDFEFVRLREIFPIEDKGIPDPP